MVLARRRLLFRGLAELTDTCYDVFVLHDVFAEGQLSLEEVLDNGTTRTVHYCSFLFSGEPVCPTIRHPLETLLGAGLSVW
mgnify:CR=1 FL=1